MFFRRTIRRNVAFCGFIFNIGMLASAQEIQHYKAVVSGMTTTMQEKQLFSDLADSDHLGEFRIDRSTGDVEFKTVHTWDHFRFEHLCTAYSLQVVSFVEVGAPHRPPVAHGTRQPRMSDMPIYIHTGDPAADDQRYEAYKAAWIAVHPDQYRELTAPQGLAIPGENE